MDFSYSEKELSHAKLAEALTKPCHSGKDGFKDTEKLCAIREALVGSGYREFLLPHAQIWVRRSFLDGSARENVVLVSSHADFVPEITKPFSVLEDDGYYKGTFDNAGTTAALVSKMVEGALPESAIVAFTADEETGKCRGAKQALEFVRGHGVEPLCIALDVTEEGFEEGCLFTIENVDAGRKTGEIFEAARALEGESPHQFLYVPLPSKKRDPSLEPPWIKERESKSCSWFDEGRAYANEGACAFSLCVPFSGQMHSNTGGRIAQPVFEGFANAIEGFVLQLAKAERCEERASEIAQENEGLFEKSKALAAEEAERTKKERESWSWSSSLWERRDWITEEEAEYRDYNASFGLGYDYDDYEDCGYEDFVDAAFWAAETMDEEAEEGEISLKKPNFKKHPEHADRALEIIGYYMSMVHPLQAGDYLNEVYAALPEDFARELFSYAGGRAGILEAEYGSDFVEELGLYDEGMTDGGVYSDAKSLEETYEEIDSACEEERE